MPILLVAFGSVMAVQSYAADPSLVQTKGLYGTVRVLAVGNNAYESAGMLDLNWAEHDAMQLSQVLRDEYGYEVTTLLGKKATRTRILGVLEEIRAASQEDDVVMLFFAGHGAVVPTRGSDPAHSVSSGDLCKPRGASVSTKAPIYTKAAYLIPYGADLNLVRPNAFRAPKSCVNRACDAAKTDCLDKLYDNEAVSMISIAKFAKDVTAQHVLVLADVCYSGFLGARGGGRLRADLQQLLRGSSRVVITAGKEDQESHESADLQHGVFTAALLGVLSKAEPISVTELFGSVRAFVADYVDRASIGARAGSTKPTAQLPQRRQIQFGDGEFAFVPLKAENYMIEARRVYARLMRRGGESTVSDDDIRLVANAIDYRQSPNAIEQQEYWIARRAVFESEASFGNAIAATALALANFKGLGKDRDVAEGFRWARNAYETKRPDARAIFGMAYYDGAGTERSPQLGQRLLEESVELDSVFGMEVLATVYLEQISQDGYPRDRREKALRYLESAAAAGYHGSALTLAGIFDQGQYGVPRNQVRALELVRAVAGAGAPYGWFALGRRIHFGGYGYPKPDPRKGVDLIRKSAEAGVPEAQVWLAEAHYGWLESSAVPRENRAARRWAEIAHANGSMDAAPILSRILADGTSGPVDIGRARSILQKAVGKGHARSMVELGFLVDLGIGGPRDPFRAISFFKDACSLGDPNGCHATGLMFTEADGVDLGGHSKTSMRPHLRYHAIHYFAQAANRGKQDSLKELEKFANEVEAEFMCGNEGWCAPGPVPPSTTLSMLKQHYPESAAIFEKLVLSKRR